MSTRLFAGNLPFSLTDRELAELFAESGGVTEAIVMMDRFTGRSRGFGFVNMATDAEARQAVMLLNGRELQGRVLTVAPAHTGGAPSPGG